MRLDEILQFLRGRYPGRRAGRLYTERAQSAAEAQARLHVGILQQAVNETGGKRIPSAGSVDEFRGKH